MAELQWWSGMRPGEVVQMRWADIERPGDGAPWVYRPRRHKSQHLRRERVIFLGPKAQAVLTRFLKADRNAPIFQPAEAEAASRSRKRRMRKTKVPPCQKLRHELAQANPKRHFHDAYDTRTYARAISRGCKEAKVPHWSPGQLRHSAATRIRGEYANLEAAQVVLGHSHANVTQIYAERDQLLSPANRAREWMIDLAGMAVLT